MELFFAFIGGLAGSFAGAFLYARFNRPHAPAPILAERHHGSQEQPFMAPEAIGLNSQTMEEWLYGPAKEGEA